jgi:hypothetical protein
MAGGVLKNKRWDLSKLKGIIKASLKSVRMVLTLLAYWEVGEFVSMVSSTNWMWEEAGYSPWRGKSLKGTIKNQGFYATH